MVNNLLSIPLTGAENVTLDTQSFRRPMLVLSKYRCRGISFRVIGHSSSTRYVTALQLYSRPEAAVRATVIGNDRLTCTHGPRLLHSPLFPKVQSSD
jgi:hypothetical protein